MYIITVSTEATGLRSKAGTVFDEKYAGRYLFFSVLITVIVVEALILLYVHLEPASQKPAVKEHAVRLRIAAEKQVCKPKPTLKPVPQQRRPKPLAKPEKVKPKPKPKPKPRPKPKPKVKPLPKPADEIRKSVEKKIEKSLEPTIEKSEAPVSAPLPAPAAKKPSVSAQKLDREKLERQKAEYLKKVRQMIERKKYYPGIAKKLRQTGEVEVQFVIQRDGSVCCAKVVRASKYRRLNHAALKTVNEIGTFGPLPKVFDEEQLILTVPINYRLK